MSQRDNPSIIRNKGDRKVLFNVRIELSSDRKTGVVSFDEWLHKRPSELILFPLMDYLPDDSDKEFFKIVLETIWILLRERRCIATIEPEAKHIVLTAIGGTAIEEECMISVRACVIQALKFWGLTSDEIHVTTTGITRG